MAAQCDDAEQAGADPLVRPVVDNLAVSAQTRGKPEVDAMDAQREIIDDIVISLISFGLVLIVLAYVVAFIIGISRDILQALF